MYKMAVLDIDGTLVTSQKTITETTRETITRMTKKNIPVCLCTGRNMTGTLPIAKKLGLTAPFVCLDGALMYDTKTRKFLYQNVLETEVVRKLLDAATSHHVYVEVTTHDHFIRYVKSLAPQRYELEGSFSKMSALAKYFFGIRYTRSLEAFYQGQKQAFEVVVSGEQEELDKVKAEALAIGSDELSLRDDVWENFVFMGRRGNRKSEGVKALCRHFGVDMKQVVAIGDEMNDLDMIKEAGLGVAMGNAREAIKEAADYVTLTNNQDGVALALTKFFEF